jgi:hypothetical protein
MKSNGSMDVECMAKPFKHCILAKDRNAPLSNERGIVLVSDLGRISSISIMPAKLSKEKFVEELSTVTVI